MVRGKKNNILLAVLITLLASIVISNYVFPVYFKSDDADMLACAQYFTKHSISILNIFSYPKPLYETVNMAMWNYYRPLERIIWTIFFALFSFNPHPLHILEIFLLIWSIYNLSKITNILSGLPTKITGMLFILVMITIFPEFFTSLLNFISHSNTFLMLFFISLSLLNLLSAFHTGTRKKIFWGILFSVCAFLSKEWSYYAIPSVLFFYFCFYWDRASNQQKRQVLKTSVLLLFILIILFLVQEMFRTNTPYRSNLKYFLSLRYVGLNFAYYKSLLLNNNAWVLIIFSLLSLLSYRNRGQIICFAWAIINLLPVLFFRNLCNNETLHYFILNIIGLAMFFSISLYLSIQDVLYSIRAKNFDYWFIKSYKRSFFLNLVMILNYIFIPIASLAILISSVNTPQYFLKVRKQTQADFFLRKRNFEKVLHAANDASFYVASEAARIFYKTMSYVHERTDINIILLDLGNLENVKIGGNILQNGSFEAGFDEWRVDAGKLFNFSQTQIFKGKRVLEVDLDAINRISTNFIDIYQDVKVMPGQIYLFGGLVKGENFDGRMWFEIREKRGFQYGSWSAHFFSPGGGKNENSWVRVCNLFVSPVEDLTFVTLRLLSPLRGKVYLSGLFITPVRGNFLDY